MLPATEDFDTMGAFIQELVDAGVLLAADGLQPSAKGARIYFDGAALALRLARGLTTGEIARAFLVPEPCGTTTCCPACAATSWSGRAATPRRGRSSSGGLR